MHVQPTIGDRQQGAVLVVVAIALVAILGMAGLALDMSHAYLNKNRLQNALDAAALSGAKSISEGANVDGATNDATATFNEHLEGEMGTAGVTPEVEFSETLIPFTPGAVEPDAKYVRVRVDSFPMDMWLAQVLPGVGNNHGVSGTAVAGPAPVGGADAETCDLAPLVMCGTPGDTDCSDGSCFGIQNIDTPTEQVVKTHSQSYDDWQVGPGNFQLLDFGSGGSTVRECLAGECSACATVGETVPTKPGNTVGPVRQGFNTRFGQYQGGVSSADYPPDTVTYSDFNGAVNNGSFWYDDYMDRQANGPLDYQNVADGGTGVPLRRVLTVPIGNCAGTENGAGQIEVLGLGCFFMTRPAPSTGGGNTQELYGQFVATCDAEGEVVEDPDDAVAYKIVLYKDDDSSDS